jgi:NhaP-type Na+/H+ or K+/H+ antiporter
MEGGVVPDEMRAVYYGPVTIAATSDAVHAVADAALGAPVVSDPSVPGDVREVLTVESGLNDGLAVPVLIVGIAWAGRRAKPLAAHEDA